MTARLAIGLHCFTDYCHAHELTHEFVDAFLDDLWRFPIAIRSPEAFSEWETEHPHLVDVGLGDPISPDFARSLQQCRISTDEFQSVVENVVEIVFASFYGASQNEPSLDSLRAVIVATSEHGVTPPAADLFSASRFGDNHGWGKPLSEAERDGWRFLTG